MSKTRTPKTYQHNNLWRIFSELTELLTVDDADFRPTPYAFTRTAELLSGASKQATIELPYGFAYGDGESGVRIEWETPAKQVRLQVPASTHEREYIYHQEGQQYNIEEPASADALARWLDWLTQK